MSNKKDNLKKSLGITEYPWSSDDDENDNLQSMPDVHILRRQPSAPRPSVADIPGTSGLSPPESTTMPPAPTQEPNHLLQDVRKRLKKDNDLFWTLIGGPHKGLSLSPTSRNTYGSTTDFRDSAGRNRSPVRDIQHVIACKKISRNLGSSRGFKPIQTPYATHAGLCGISKNISPSSAQKITANFKTNRTRRTLPGHMLSPIYETSAPQCIVPIINQPLSGLSQTRHKHSSTSRMLGIDTLPVSTAVHVPMNVNQSDDELELHAAALRAQIRNENLSPAEGGAGETNDVSSGRMSLEEEIVEIEPQPEVRVNEESSVRLQNSGQEQTEETANTNNEADNVNPQPSLCGVKRKKEDETDPFCVKELNQNLLRLLECPVCLEWMEPPMSQCRRGHLVCNSCRMRLCSCPVCRTTFSSVRNRAMEEVADMVRYPCRHGCGREARLRRRGAHEASCAARRYHCPAPACAGAAPPPLPLPELRAHLQSKHAPMLKTGSKHTFSVKVNSEQHDHWFVVAFQDLFYVRVDIEIRSWNIIIYVAYVGPKCNSKKYIYEVTVNGQHNSRKLSYVRTTHSDLDNSSLNISRKDCFHLTFDQAINFLRYRNKRCETDKSLDFNVEISKCESALSRDDSDS